MIRQRSRKASAHCSTTPTVAARWVQRLGTEPRSSSPTTCSLGASGPPSTACDDDAVSQPASRPMTDPPSELHGAAMITASWIGTGVYVVTALVATVFPDGFAVAAVTVSLVLFVIGCAVFLWAYFVAVQRSRTDLIGIGGLYFLQGTAPKIV